MYKCTYKIRYSDLKDFDTVKNSSVIDFLQDISVRHSESVGYSIKKLYEYGIAWLLKGWKIDFIDKIDPSKDITVETGVRNPKRVTSDRLYTITQDGVLKVKCTSVWFSFDVVNLKPCKVPGEIVDLYLKTPVTDDFDTYKNPEDFADGETLDTITVSARDIDTNHHLNNQKSAEMLMSAVPEDFSYKSAVIHYKKAAHLNDCLTVSRKIENNSCLVRLSMNGETCVLGQFEK